MEPKSDITQYQNGDVYEKITCPGKRKHTRNSQKSEYNHHVCGRTLIFLPIDGVVEESVLPPCKSCGTVIGVLQDSTGITINVRDKQKLKWVQTLRKIKYGYDK